MIPSTGPETFSWSPCTKVWRQKNDSTSSGLDSHPIGFRPGVRTRPRTGAGARPRAAAPVDFTGYWVSVVSEDWRWRMVTPARGDFASIPFNAEGRRIGLTWDPAKDEAAGEQCRAYGAAAIMRRPGRLHITWQDDTTLRIDTDEG